MGTLRARISTLMLGAGRLFARALLANEPSSGIPQFCFDSFAGFGEPPVIGFSGFWGSLIIIF